jgi:ribosomal protein L40E
MRKDFVELTQKVVKERGKDILNNGRLTKALLMDYSHGECKNEINLFCRTIELGYPKKIMEAEDIGIVKSILVRQLTENNFIIEKVAVSIVSLLISLIKDIRYNGETTEESIKKLEKDHGEQTVVVSATKQVLKNKSLPANPVLEEDIIKRSLEIWICGRCKTSNNFDRDYCKKCGKEFNPPFENNSSRNDIIKIQPALWEKK